MMMVTPEDLRTELAEYDGRDTSTLSEITRRHRDQPGFLTALVALAPDQDTTISDGATWILRAELEAGRTLSPRSVRTLTKVLPRITAWQAQLHICQSIGCIDIPAALVPALGHWLRARLDAPRPFLRAWALDALVGLYGNTPEIRSLLDQMESDSAASVRARVRNLRRRAGV
ncbi:hypothetical protein [uncultured Roseobacter sp.]|uniref:hypothetical protein n=1 Tax=uncultured Roseobacter sp. TaxID=114847 RepID=UPI00260770E8|nr:hypothetical protein [uncultured Roseobacter sp.]